MTYELAKQLKEAGFPQEDRAFYFEGKTTFSISSENDNFNGGYEQEVYCADPTLEELIEACGDKFQELSRGWKIWHAGAGEWLGDSDYEFMGEGETPKEAVANLWLKLNK